LTYNEYSNSCRLILLQDNKNALLRFIWYL